MTTIHEAPIVDEEKFIQEAGNTLINPAFAADLQEGATLGCKSDRPAVAEQEDRR
jgi:hypothetical protein